MVVERSASLLELTKEVLYTADLKSESYNDSLFCSYLYPSLRHASDGGQIVSTRRLLYCQCMIYDTSSSSTTTLVLEQGVGRYQST
jgi:hypothetical protein